MRHAPWALTVLHYAEQHPTVDSRQSTVAMIVFLDESFPRIKKFYMFRIHIGSSSEFVTLQIHQDPKTPDHLEVGVEIKVNGFSGAISAFFEPVDFNVFAAELQTLYDSLNGRAELPSRDEQLTLMLKGTGMGGIEVFGKAWLVACYGNKLEFEFDIDQTFLPGVLAQLHDLNMALK